MVKFSRLYSHPVMNESLCGVQWEIPRLEPLIRMTVGNFRRCLRRDHLAAAI